MAPTRPTTFLLSDDPGPDTFAAIFDALDACTVSLLGPAASRLLVIPIHDDAGTVMGGLWGHTQFLWLQVELLVVPESLRGRGVGTDLMAVATAEARNRGCIGILVDAFSMQAAPFFRKLGFTEFGVLDNFPPGYQRLYFQRRLDAPPTLPTALG